MQPRFHHDITINFGENYPVDFDMVGSNGQVIQFRDNVESLFTTEEVLENTTVVKLIFYTMKNPQTRLRIYSIRFGYGLVYYNEDVMASQLESYISPIGADVPQIDFSVIPPISWMALSTKWYATSLTS